MPIKVFATLDNGDGYVQEVGTYDDWNDIEIRIGAFRADCVITFLVENEEE